MNDSQSEDIFNVASILSLQQAYAAGEAEGDQHEMKKPSMPERKTSPARSI